MAIRKPKRTATEETHSEYIKTEEVGLQLTKIQKPIINGMIENQITVLTGDPGTGKTTLALYFAIKQLLNKSVEKIYISKNPVESGKSVGFLPGELEDKLAPYKESYFAVLEKILGKTHIGNLVKKGKIEFIPLGFIRGRTFENAIIILDEAQNLELHDLMSFVTRVHETSKMILLGDALQSDIQRTGLPALLSILANVKGTNVQELGDEFQMRSKIIVDIYNNYKKYLKENKK